MRSLLEPLVFVNIPKYGFFFFIPYTQHRRPFDPRFATTARQGQQHNEEYDLNVMVARRLRPNIII